MVEREDEERNVYFAVFGLQSVSAANNLKRAILAERGIISASVDFALERAIVRYNVEETRPENIIHAAKKFGVHLELYNENTADLVKRRREKDYLNVKKGLIFSAICAIPLFLIMILRYFNADFSFSRNPAFQLVFATPVIILLGYKYLLDAVKSPFSISTLAVIGSFSAYFLSVYKGFFVEKIPSSYDLYFDTSVLILVFIQLGKFFRMRTKRIIAQETGAFAKDNAKIATVVRDDNREELRDVTAIKENDILIVKEGEHIAADGTIISGSTSVDEGMLTGASFPLDKKVGDKVFAGSVNLMNPITITVSGVGEKTEFARIARMVEDTQIKKTPNQRLMENVSKIFVIGIPVIVIIVSIVNVFLGKELQEILLTGASILMISCPCALGLASTAPTMSGVSVGLKYGILFKIGEALELLKKMKVLVLGKTETITSGTLSVYEIKPYRSIALNDIHNILFTMASRSNHPITKSIVKYCQNLGGESLLCSEVEVSSCNVKATIYGDVYAVGTYEYCESQGGRVVAVKPVCYRYELSGELSNILMKNGEIIALIAFSDTVRETARQAISKLCEANISVYMLTQDSKNFAARIAGLVGISSDKIAAGLKPEEKADAIEAIAEQEKTVAMVAKGINDAVAMSNAQIGITMGSEADATVDVSHIVIKNYDLLNVCRAIGISNKTSKIVTQNLVLACAFNVIGIPFAIIFNALDPQIASLAMTVSSACVLANSFRMNAYKFDSANEISIGLRPTQKMNAIT
ncbi:MAG: cation-translocating P-type ATPase [Chitinivibrionia bacterium]|nr:cation-translocating P-type ATPase [Chitinivibrionia bacterium]